MVVNRISNSGNTAATQGNSMTLFSDSYTKNVQQLIANAQKKLQDLSSDEEMTLEEKMKKRQEIQQEITSLQQQLRQHQLEQRKEKQSKNTMDDMLGGNRNVNSSGKNGAGLSQASMQAMISADSSMKQAEVQGNMATQMEGKAGVLKAEIQADKGRGSGTEAKEAELAELTERVQDTQSTQAKTLSNSVKTMEKAAEADQTTETDVNDSSKNAENAEKSDGAENSGTKIDASADGMSAPTTDSGVDIAQTGNVHVDVRL